MLLDRADEKWLRQIFTSKIFYWKEYNLIAFTTPPHEVDGYQKFIFQNSVDDTPYQYEDWEKIFSLQWIVDKVKAISEENLAWMCDTEYFESEEDIMQARLYFLSHFIYDELDIQKWMQKDKTSEKVFIVDVTFLEDIYLEAKIYENCKGIQKEIFGGKRRSQKTTQTIKNHFQNGNSLKTKKAYYLKIVCLFICTF